MNAIQCCQLAQECIRTETWNWCSENWNQYRNFTRKRLCI